MKLFEYLLQYWWMQRMLTASKRYRMEKCWVHSIAYIPQNFEEALKELNNYLEGREAS